MVRFSFSEMPEFFDKMLSEGRTGTKSGIQPTYLEPQKKRRQSLIDAMFQVLI